MLQSLDENTTIEEFEQYKYFITTIIDVKHKTIEYREKKKAFKRKKEIKQVTDAVKNTLLTPYNKFSELYEEFQLRGMEMFKKEIPYKTKMKKELDEFNSNRRP